MKTFSRASDKRPSLSELDLSRCFNKSNKKWSIPSHFHLIPFQFHFYDNPIQFQCFQVECTGHRYQGGERMRRLPPWPHTWDWSDFYSTHLILHSQNEINVYSSYPRKVKCSNISFSWKEGTSPPSPSQYLIAERLLTPLTFLKLVFYCKSSYTFYIIYIYYIILYIFSWFDNSLTISFQCRFDPQLPRGLARGRKVQHSLAAQ